MVDAPEWIYYMNFLLPGVLIPASIPLILEKIEPNYFYGFRTKKTLSNEDIWYRANKYSGKVMLITGIISLVALLLALPFQSMLAFWTFQTIGWIAAGVPTVVMIVMSFLFLKKI